MNTRQLRYLVTVARIGNLSHAAGHLGISQPALSKLIRTWEETYGFPLFLRFGHKLAPTAIGRLYLDYAQRILDEQNRMILTMRSMGGEQGQSIRLCTAPNRASIIYSEIFHRFARVYPDIELNLIEQYALNQKQACELNDQFLIRGCVLDPQFCSYRLLNAPLFFAVLVVFRDPVPLV